MFLAGLVCGYVVSLALSLLVLGLCRAAGRRPRRPGYIRPLLNASDSESQGTARAPGTSTGCRRVGPLQAVMDGPVQLRERSRTTAPTYSGSGTETNPGDPTTVAAGRDLGGGLALHRVPAGFALWTEAEQKAHAQRAFEQLGYGSSPVERHVWPDGVTRFYEGGQSHGDAGKADAWDGYGGDAA